LAFGIMNAKGVIDIGSALIAKMFSNLVASNGGVGCRRVFAWMVLLLISVLLRVY